jgi:hypothetical protein
MSAKLHWNYFVALERDLETLSRYVEFAESNFHTYSIEIAHLLFASASEVDVIAKLLCKRLDPNMPAGNIDDYQKVLTKHLPGLRDTEVRIPRFGLSMKPWLGWGKQKNPAWWRNYNDVKHQRDIYFNRATLKNALDAMSALLVLIFHHYRLLLSEGKLKTLSPADVTNELQPESKLLRLDESYYFFQIVGANPGW